VHRGVIIAGAVTDLCRRREGALQSSPVCSADSRGWLGIIAELDARSFRRPWLPAARVGCCVRPPRCGHADGRRTDRADVVSLCRDCRLVVPTRTARWPVLLPAGHSFRATPRHGARRTADRKRAIPTRGRSRPGILRPMPVISRSSSAGGQVAADFRQPATAAPAQAAGWV